MRWDRAALAAVPTAAAVALRAMGRRWWCRCGSWAPWSGVVNSRHNSQHLLDPYSFSHVLHGLLLYGLTRPLAGRVSATWRLVAVVAAEAAWELLENTDAVIQRYRTATISLDYDGDTVVNSLGDVGCCVLGFAVAARAPWWVSVLVFVATELVLAWWIRDGLLLNVLMLVAPSDAVRAWQAG